jgi:hypothetical protein
MELDNPAAWKEAFDAFMAEFADCYKRAESRESSDLYVRGLLAKGCGRSSRSSSALCRAWA